MHPTVVVVDDEPPIVEVVCEALEEEEITAVACAHGHEAYPCIRRHRPKVVILDVQMPGVDGIEVFQRLRADPATSAIPVIFFTANAQKVLQRIPNYRALGAQLLSKPFDVDKLLDMVTRALAA